MEFNITLNSDNENQAKDFESQIKSLQGVSIEKVRFSGFDGISSIIYFIAAGGGGASIIYALEKIIIALINKDGVKSVKIGDKEIKGYSKNDVAKLLQMIGMSLVRTY